MITFGSLIVYKGYKKGHIKEIIWELLPGKSKWGRLAAGFLSSVKKWLKERVGGIDRKGDSYSLNSFSLPSLTIKKTFR